VYLARFVLAVLTLTGAVRQFMQSKPRRGVSLQLRAAMLLAGLAAFSPSHADLGPPWQWTVEPIPGHFYGSQQKAESELRGLAGKYALAEVIEDEQMTESTVTYTFGAKPRGPNLGSWNDYLPGNGTTEASATAILESQYPSYAGCPAALAEPTEEWSGWMYWYSGDASQQIRRYRVRSYSDTGNPQAPCGEYTVATQIWRNRVVACPAFMAWDSTTNACELHDIATITGPVICDCNKVGNPVSVGTGNKSLDEIDLELPWISFRRGYQSLAGALNGRFGRHWTHSFNVRLIKSGSTVRGILTETGHHLPVKSSEVIDGSGEWITSSNGVDKWTRRNGSSRTFQGATGRLVRDDLADGSWYTYAYDTFGKLTTVTHSSGRSLTFIYQFVAIAAESRIKEVRSGSSVLLTYDYDNVQGNLVAVHRADGSTRQYVYENSIYPGFVTGVLDEAGNRFATYAYDSDGRAILSEHAGGAGRVELEYAVDGSTRVTDSLGKLSIYRFTNDGYFRKPISVEVQGATQSWTLPAPSTDFRRRPTQSIDRNGVITNYEYTLIYDYDINGYLLRTRRTEAFGTPRARVIDVFQIYSTAQIWKEVTSTKSTTYSYNSRGQVLTRTEKDISANVQRTVTNAYCETVNLAAGCPWIGLLKSVDGPRTDVTDATSFEYDAQGNLYRTTTALGHVTTYNAYNAHGQPTQITDANGYITGLTYDARQRLTDRCTGGTLPGCSGGELTHLDYWPTGLLKRVTNADGSYVDYAYDAAHRLTEIRDGTLNRIVYTLDTMGNRTAEHTYDPSNALRRTHTRVFNTLNQLWKDVNAAGSAAVTTTFGYDNNENQTATNAPLARNSTSLYDELNRLKQITDPASGNTLFGYDANDNLTSVTDPRSLITSYTYNGFGDLKTQTSPDTGLITNTYDSGGNLDTSTDSRGAVTDYAYDATNRVTSASFTLGGFTDQTITYAYDAGTNQKGHLTGASDANHSLAWSYDTQGRITGKGQTVGGTTLAIGYGYNAAGQLSSTVLPSGSTVGFGYNANGQVTSLTLNGSTTILSSITYDPFGPITGWTWGNSTTASRAFDTDGKITQVDNASGASLKNYAYDDAFRITGISDAADSTLSWTYGYDNLDRLNSASKTGITQGWTYDANGNRLTETGSTPSTYTNASISNRVSSISGSLPRTYGYDNAGNTLSYAGATFTYSNRGRMATATNGGVTAAYTYNALGQRISRTASGVTTLYAYDEAGHLAGEYSSTGALIQETVWLGDIPVATLRQNGMGGVIVYYVHADHLNTPRLVTDTSNNIRWRWDSDPFGSMIPNENPSSLGVFSYNLRFPGQQYDAVVGLHYNYFRDYDPASGRYTKSDPIGLSGGLNTFSYAYSNPIHRSDPSGLMPNALEATCVDPAQPVCWLGVIIDVASSYALRTSAAAAVGTALSTPSDTSEGGAAAGPAPFDKEAENEALCFMPDPFGGDEHCKQLAKAISVLRAQINWRRTDLNPLSPSYRGHLERIALLSVALTKLEKAYRDICGGRPLK
jgi:RHS repeat-associated protein